MGTSSPAPGLEQEPTDPGTAPGDDDRLEGASPQRELAAGERLGPYEILYRLGSGGMGAVLAAVDTRRGQRVALKLLHEEAPWRRRRLVHEAWAMARLTHPNVVTVHDVGEQDGRTFVAMELVEGVDLRRWLGERPREPERIVEVFLAAGRGLAAAHRADLVHCDFKPSNVLVADDGRVLVTDFGLAAIDASRVDVSNDDTDPLQLGTRRGQLDEPRRAGTPGFMAPEQWDALPAVPATDQFAFCVSLYQALMGAHPFGLEADHYLRVMEQRIGPHPPPSRLAARVRPLLLRGMRVEPGRRWSSMPALLDAIESAAHGRGPRRTYLAAGATMLGAAGLVAALAWKQAPSEDRATDATADETELPGPDDVDARPPHARRDAARGRLAVATVLEDEGRYGDALTVLDEAVLSLVPDLDVELYDDVQRRRADLLERLGHHEQARAVRTGERAAY